MCFDRQDSGPQPLPDSWVPPGQDAQGYAPQTTCGFAIAALVLGIVSYFCLGFLASLPGLVLGIVALSKIGNSNGTLGGRGLAIAGVVLSGLNMLIYAMLVVALVVPALAKARGQAQQVQASSNLRQLGLAAAMFADDNGKLPEASEWCDLLSEYAGDPKVFQSPAVPELGCGFAFNENLSGVDFDSVEDPSMTVLLFESDGGWNSAGDSSDLIAEPRYPDGYLFLFVDGSVRFVSVWEVDDLIWEP